MSHFSRLTMIPRKDIALLILFFVGIATLWFSSNSFATDENYRPVNTFVTVATDDLLESVTALDAAARAFHKNPQSAQNVKNAIAETRLKYKKIEFYLAFYYPEFTTGFLNGAPLLQTESEANVTNVKDPEGLQVLDEMAGADDKELAEERSKLVVLSRKLVQSYGILHRGLKQRNFAQYGEIDAMRLQLIRIFSLGITGLTRPEL